jgi:TrmH family RNA methyltransferase
MLSKNKIKLIQSLNRKKNRDEAGFFLVEGNKMVEEAIRSGFEIGLLACTSSFAQSHPEIYQLSTELIVTTEESIAKASLLQHPQDSLAVIRKPLITETAKITGNELILALDDLQDPGNLGTIIRIADWFGINQLVCSENTVDCYNPKVVQASMGSIFRVKIKVTNLIPFIDEASELNMPVYGTFMAGENIYRQPLSNNGIVILGNEGNGISHAVSRKIKQKLLIPCFSAHENQPESLNVATAAAICCSEFRRRS